MKTGFLLVKLSRDYDQMPLKNCIKLGDYENEFESLENSRNDHLCMT
jgi:hypothetical protein